MASFIIKPERISCAALSDGENINSRNGTEKGGLWGELIKLHILDDLLSSWASFSGSIGPQECEMLSVRRKLVSLSNFSI